MAEEFPVFAMILPEFAVVKQPYRGDTGELIPPDRFPAIGTVQTDFAGQEQSGWRVELGNPSEFGVFAARNVGIAADGAGNVVVVHDSDTDGNNIWNIRAISYPNFDDGPGAIGSQITPNNLQVDVFRVNSDTSGQQLHPDVAMMLGRDGTYIRYAVVWQDARSGDYEIRMRGYTLTGQGGGGFPDKTVSSNASLGHTNPRLGVDSEANVYVPVWVAEEGGSIRAAIVGWNGQVIQPEFVVAQSPNGGLGRPDVVINRRGLGTFYLIFAWDDDSDQNGRSQVRAQSFTSGGQPSSDRITVNKVDRRSQYSPSLAISGDNWVCVWTDERDGFANIWMRGFRWDMTERFDERPVYNVQTVRPDEVDAGRPRVAMKSDDTFVVSWLNSDEDMNELWASLRFADGDPATQFRVLTPTPPIRGVRDRDRETWRRWRSSLWHDVAFLGSE